MRIRTITTAAIITLATATQGFSMDSLSQYGWKNRVLVVFGTAGDEKMTQQVALLKNQSTELADRDMVVLLVSGDTVKAIYGSAGDIDADTLRADAGISGDDFQAILVGKDGGVKLRSDTVVGDVEMFDLIDRMPMRKAGQS